jgi:hypothetical protein
MDEHGKHRMSKKSREELVRSIHPRYLKASRSEKGHILDEFVASTGYHRKHAIRLLKHGVPEHRRERRGRRRTYRGETVAVLVKVWSPNEVQSQFGLSDPYSPPLLSKTVVWFSSNMHRSHHHR